MVREELISAAGAVKIFRVWGAAKSRALSKFYWVVVEGGVALRYFSIGISKYINS